MTNKGKKKYKRENPIFNQEKRLIEREKISMIYLVVFLNAQK